MANLEDLVPEEFLTSSRVAAGLFRGEAVDGAPSNSRCRRRAAARKRLVRNDCVRRRGWNANV